MYNASVMDHVIRPRNNERLTQATHEGVAGDPGEGPYLLLWLEVKEEKIICASYETYGCPAAIACGSAVAEWVIGKSLQEADLITEKALISLLHGLPEGKEHCPQLAVNALQSALRNEKRLFF